MKTGEGEDAKRDDGLIGKKILVTGGGSGGHTSTALAVIEEMKRQDPGVLDRLLFVGGSLGMIGDKEGGSYEGRVVPEAGVPFVAIRGGKLHRKWGLYTVRLLWPVIFGFIDAWKVLREFKPDIVFSTGGYVTVPVVIVAWLLRVPVVIHEQTTVSGLANRIGARFARKVLVSFESSKEQFPEGKAVYTGLPVRNVVFQTDLGKVEGLEDGVRNQLAAMIERKDKFPLIYYTGGGLGSHKINLIFLEILPELLKKYQLVLQCGRNKLYNDYDKLTKARVKLPEELRERLLVREFIGEEIGVVFHNAEIVVGRSGANFVSELLALRKKCVLIPIPWSSGNEQHKNAEVLEEKRLGRILEEEELTGRRLVEAVGNLLELRRKDTVPRRSQAASLVVEVLDRQLI